MCNVSMVGDHFRDKWLPNIPDYQRLAQTVQTYQYASRAELTELQRQLAALKQEVQEMKQLLQRAKEEDERTGQTDCEMDTKIDVLKKVAELVGVNLDDVLKKKKSK